MTTQPDLLEAVHEGPDGDAALPTYVVLARFREPAPGREAAVRQVAERLAAAGQPVDELAAAPRPSDGAWPVTARFVVVSLEPHTAAAGVHAALRDAGVPADEVWADARCA